MEFETIDETRGNLPEEAVIEIKKMGKWINFTGVMSIIFAILGILGNLGSFARSSDPLFILSMALNLVSMYLGFMLIKKAGLFTSYADNHNEEQLIESLKVTKNFWMITTIMLIVSILLSIKG